MAMVMSKTKKLSMIQTAIKTLSESNKIDENAKKRGVIALKEGLRKLKN